MLEAAAATGAGRSDPLQGEAVRAVLVALAVGGGHCALLPVPRAGWGDATAVLLVRSGEQPLASTPPDEVLRQGDVAVLFGEATLPR